MARITDKDLWYDESGNKKWKIPAGTPVGMTTILMHLDEKVYPDPLRFDPQRWIDGEGKAGGHALGRYFAPFSRGTRICLGMQ